MLKDIFAGSIKDLFFPAFCFGCANEGSFLCDKCYESLIKKIPNPEIKSAFAPDESDTSLDGIMAVFPYDEKALPAGLIHAFKYDLIKELYKPLGRMIAGRLIAGRMILGRPHDFPAADVVLCPVPLHKKRQKWRGFNQSALLAEHAGKITGLPVIYPLKRIHFRSPQMELKREERIKNVRNAFVIDDKFGDGILKISEKSIFLVDDVATTLSTLRECARTLKNAGCKKVYAIVLARVC